MQSVIESVFIFVVMITISRYFVSAEPEPQGGLAQGFGQLAGSALGAAAGSFARETFGGGGRRGFGNQGFGGQGFGNQGIANMY